MGDDPNFPLPLREGVRGRGLCKVRDPLPLTPSRRGRGDNFNYNYNYNYNYDYKCNYSCNYVQSLP